MNRIPVKTRFLDDTDVAASLFASLAQRADDIWIATAWASDGSSVSSALWKGRHRLAALVVGLDFHQTAPAFLRRFRPWVKVHETADGTFHPKVYLFRDGTRFDCILGSSNLTRAGFAGNVEANVHMAGHTGDPTFARLVAFIEELGEAGRLMSKRELDWYMAQWRKRQGDVQRLKRIQRAPKKTAPSGPISLNVDWHDFVSGMLKIGARKGHAIFPDGDDRIGYVGVIEAMQRLFRAKRRLSAMSLEQRQKVGGLVKPYMYFGTMRGAGSFVHYLRDKSSVLDSALDHIPPRPSQVARHHFDRFVASITRTKGLGRPAVGSRLLAMKRPDTFLCLDSANRVGLAKSFGFTPTELNSYKGYWALHEVLWDCPWYKTGRPKGRYQAIWDARVALLDAFFYQG